MTAFVAMPDGRRIACRYAAPAAGSTAPVVVFLPGYRSDMAGSKATALFDRAVAERRGCLLFDYSGCGASDGDFAAGTLTRWRDEALAVIAAHAPHASLLPVGSSMGGWLMLLVARALPPARLAGLVGIAAAPDFTDWGFSAEAKAALAAGRTIHARNAHGPEPTPYHPGLYADAAEHLQLGGAVPVDAPVHLLHGQADADVPWDVSLRLAEALRSARVQLHLVKDGDHRLSRAADLALLHACVADLLGREFPCAI